MYFKLITYFNTIFWIYKIVYFLTSPELMPNIEKIAAQTINKQTHTRDEEKELYMTFKNKTKT